jgi:hypothetical protein
MHLPHALVEPGIRLGRGLALGLLLALDIELGNGVGCIGGKGRIGRGVDDLDQPRPFDRNALQAAQEGADQMLRLKRARRRQGRGRFPLGGEFGLDADQRQSARKPGFADFQRAGLRRAQGGVEGGMVDEIQPFDHFQRRVPRADDRGLGHRGQPVGIDVLRDLVDVDDLLALGLHHDDGFGFVERRQPADIEGREHRADSGHRRDHDLAPAQRGRDPAQVERFLFDRGELRGRCAEGLYVRRQLLSGAHFLCGDPLQSRAGRGRMLRGNLRTGVGPPRSCRPGGPGRRAWHRSRRSPLRSGGSP